MIDFPSPFHRFIAGAVAILVQKDIDDYFTGRFAPVLEVVPEAGKFRKGSKKQEKLQKYLSDVNIIDAKLDTPRILQFIVAGGMRTVILALEGGVIPKTDFRPDDMEGRLDAVKRSVLSKGIITFMKSVNTEGLWLYVTSSLKEEGTDYQSRLKSALEEQGVSVNGVFPSSPRWVKRFVFQKRLHENWQLALTMAKSI